MYWTGFSKPKRLEEFQVIEKMIDSDIYTIWTWLRLYQVKHMRKTIDYSYD